MDETLEQLRTEHATVKEVLRELLCAVLMPESTDRGAERRHIALYVAIEKARTVLDLRGME